MKNQPFLFITLLLLLLLSCTSAFAQEPEAPAGIALNEPIQCGDQFTFTLLKKPLVQASQSSIIADDDMNYMMVQARIVNQTGKVIEGLETDSFVLDDFFRGEHYYTYTLDAVMSGKVSVDWGFSPFFQPMTIDESRDLFIVFEMFRGADAWELSFKPRPYGSEQAVCEVTLQLPEPDFGK